MSKEKRWGAHGKAKSELPERKKVMPSVLDCYPGASRGDLLLFHQLFLLTRMFAFVRFTLDLTTSGAVHIVGISREGAGKVRRWRRSFQSCAREPYRVR